MKCAIINIKYGDSWLLDCQLRLVGRFSQPTLQIITFYILFLTLEQAHDKINNTKPKIPR